MLLKLTEKIIRENVYEQKKKKLGLNLTLGKAPIGLRATGRVCVHTFKPSCGFRLCYVSPGYLFMII